MQRHLWDGTQPRPAPAEGGQVPPAPLGRASAALVHENEADAPPTPGPDHTRRRARLQRCEVSDCCAICHPPDEHLWRTAEGRVVAWRLVYSATDLETASLKARHAQAHPLLRGNPVPAVLQALASDGQLQPVASLRSRPGDSGIIRVATRENGLRGCHARIPPGGRE